MMAELESPSVPLLVQSPNGLDLTGEHGDWWMVSPSLHSPEHFKMLRFLGQLMGLALRSEMPIELNLASTVWKNLVGETLTSHDLKNVDKAIYNSFLGQPEVSVEDALAMAAGESIVCCPLIAT